MSELSARTFIHLSIQLFPWLFKQYFRTIQYYAEYNWESKEMRGE